MNSPLIGIALAVALWPAFALAQTATISRASGGSVRIDLGYGITVNKNSTLEREWITVHHRNFPASFAGTAGVKTVYKPDRVRGEYNYVADLQPGSHSLNGSWRILSENEASEFYASIAYVAVVRTKTGRIVTADTAPVIEEARKFSSKFSAQDLEPKREPPRGI
jgi:hypothetical protein